MPSKNVVKFYDADTYYHVYNRGVEKRQIFLDEQDYSVFAHLLKRYLGDQPEKDSSGREYKRLTDEVELIAFCLMANHFHLLLYQIEPEATTKLLRAVSTSYTRYFNKKYERVGGLFQGTFKAKQIGDEAYLQHISRYIHLNPGDYLGWEWSSLPAYLGYTRIDWIHPERLVDIAQPGQYLRFIEDYNSYEESLEQIEPHLAHL